MLKLFKSNSAIAVMETGAMTLLAFATFSVLARVTSLEIVGVWVLVNSLLGFSRAADFWTRGLASFVGEAVGKGDGPVAVGFVATSAFTGAMGYLALSLMAAPLIYVFADSIVGANNAELLRSILPLMMGIFWITCMASVYQLGFLGFGRLGWKAVLTVSGQVMFLMGSIILAPRLGLLGILYAQAFQGLVVLLASIIIFHFHVAGSRPDRWWDIARFKQLYAFGTKSLMVAVVQMAIEPVIRLLGAAYGGLAQVAIIEMASRLLGAARNLVSSVGQVMVPRFAMHIGTDGKERARLYDDAIIFFALLAWPITGLVLAASPLAALLAFGKPVAMLGVYNVLLGLGWLTNLISAPAYFMLMGNRHLRPMLINHLVMSAGAFILGHIGGQLYGILGAMTGVAIALTASSVYLVHIIRHQYGIERTSFAAFIPGWKPLIPAIAGILTVYWQMHYLPQAGLFESAALIVPTLVLALVLTPIRRLSNLAVALDRR